MHQDGAQGVKDLVLNHGEVLLQDPSTALFQDMPRAAVEAVPTARILNLKGIADRINACSRDYMTLRSYRSVFQRALA